MDLIQFVFFFKWGLYKNDPAKCFIKTKYGVVVWASNYDRKWKETKDNKYEAIFKL